MRIMLVSHRFPPDDVGGVEQYTQSLASELSRQGDSVSVVARRYDSGRHQRGIVRERLSDRVLLYRIPGPTYRPDHFLDGQHHVDQLFTIAAIEAAPEVVHMNHLIGFSPQLIQLSHKLGAAVVTSLHDFYFACPRVHLQKASLDLCKGPALGRECATSCFTDGSRGNTLYWGLRTMYFQRSLEISERVIAYSRHVAAYFQPMRGSPIEVIENGIVPECIHRGAPEPVVRDGGLTLAYCGTVAPHKGVHIILDELRIARLGRVRLLLLGQTPDISYGATLRKKAAAVPGLQLQMYGKFSRHELPHLLRGVDCVVVPSLVPEAGPIVPREALGLGVPVLASKLGALPELIAEGENGYSFNPRTSGELAAMFRQLTYDENLLGHLRAGARRSPVVTLAAHAERVRAVYEGAIQDFRSRCADSTSASELEFLHKALMERKHDGQLTLTVGQNR